MKNRPLFHHILAATILIAVPAARAVSDAWNVNADGLYNDPLNWLAGNVPGSTSLLNSTDVATFGFTLTAARAVSVDANRNVGGITFSNTSAFGYTLNDGSLKLSNGGVIQLTGNTGAHTDTINTPIEIEGDGGAATFSSSSTLATRLLKIGAVSGVSTGANVTTLTLNGTQSPSGVLENAVAGVIDDGIGGGRLAIVKNDAGAWTVSNPSNSFSGGSTLNAGILRATTGGALGVGGVTLAGGQLHLINNTNTFFTAHTTVTGNTQISATRVSGSAGTIAHTLGTLSIGANTLTLGTFSATTAASLTFGNTTLTGNATFSPATKTTLVLGRVFGNFSLTKTGVGTLTLGEDNTYSGGTVVGAGGGVLQIGSGGTTGSILGSIANDANVTFNRSNALTYGGNISGAGTVIKLGAGVTTLTGTNTYTGATILKNGVLSATGPALSASNLSIGDTANRTIYGLLGIPAGDTFTRPLGTGAGQVQWLAASGGFAAVGAGTAFVNIGGSATPDPLSIGVGGFYSGSTGQGATTDYRLALGHATSAGTTDFRNPVDLNGKRMVIIVGNGSAAIDVVFSGNITGTGTATQGLVKFDNGVLKLTGTNTFTGNTVVGGDGAIVAGSAGALSPNSNIELNGVNNGLGGVLGLGVGDLNATLGTGATQLNWANASGGFAAYGADRKVTLNADAPLTWAVTPNFVVNNQLLVLGMTGADATLTLTNDLDLGAATRTVFVNRGTDTVDAVLEGDLTGAGGLTKSGPGILNLDGTQTYPTLNANGGVTNVNGSFTTGTATVNANATTNFRASQTLAALNIASGVTVTFGPAAASAAFAGEENVIAAVQAVPEPSAALSFLGGVALLLGLRRRRTSCV